MSQPTYAIRGIPVPAGQPTPTRKEITTWVSNNPLQVSLFMRALTEFQQLSPTQDPLSYYRIAGSCLYQILRSIFLILLTYQEFMETPTYLGMESATLKELASPAFGAHITGQRSQHGTAPT